MTDTDVLETDLTFYKYIQELSPEMRWHGDELLIWLYYFQMEDFMKIWKDHASVFDDGGIEAHMMDGYICFDIGNMLEYVGLNPEAILAKGEELS